MHDWREVKRWLIAGGVATLLIVLSVGIVVPRLIREPKPLPERSRNIRATELVLVEEESIEEEELTRQIVSIDAPETEAVPRDARYEDRVNRVVDEETVARDRRLGMPSPAVAVAGPQPERQREPERNDASEQTELRALPEEAETEADPADAVAMVEDPRSRENVRQSDIPDGESAEPAPNFLGAFNPTLANASEFIAIPGAEMDHLDLPEGERTALNSVQNVYWSYWNRVRNQVRPHWEPNRVYRRNDPSGRIFGVEDRYTVLRVTLNGDGSLRHVYLERSSDLEFLDREAIRAIRNAQPFANVPEGLKNDDGLLSFQFGFYFEVGSSHFRIRREDWPL